MAHRADNPGRWRHRDVTRQNRFDSVARKDERHG